MVVGIIILAATYLERNTIIAICVVLLILKLIALKQRGKLVLNYDKSNALYDKFVKQTQISKLVYEPYILSPTPAF